MKTVYSLKSIYCIVLSALFFVFTNTAFAQTLTSDTSDYAPGSTVLLNGSGFSFGEPVVVQVLHDDMMGGDDSLEAHQPWEVMADSFGNFTTSWYVFEYGDQQGANLVAIADGQSSFLHAEAFFTDAATPPVCNISGNFSGCAGSQITYTGPTGVGFTYTWTILNNTTGASFSGSSTARIVTVNLGNTGGAFTIQLKVNSGAPFLICSQTVTVIGLPSCSITPANPVCPGTQNSYSGAAGMSAYSWSISGSGSLSGATNTQSATADASNVCNGSYTLTLISSLNGCSSTCSQLINVRDNTAPTITQPGANYTLSCGSNPVFTEPTASDDCSTPTVVLVSDVTTPGSCSGSYIRTKSWKAVDGCSNESAIVSQTVSVIDAAAPSIENPDNDGAVIACHETPVFNAPEAHDGCDANPSVVVVSDVTTGGDCPGTYSRTVCWRAVDCSGNQSEQVCKTVNVIDDEAPSISDPGEDVTIACPGSPQFTTPVATDGCDESPVVILVSDVTEEGDAPGAYSRTLCWKAVDCSGNESNTVCETISVINNTPASIGAPVTACDSYTLPWGDAVTSTGDYSHHYISQGGCDSTASIHVTIYHGFNITGNSTVACDSYALPWGGEATTSNDYSHTYTSVNGCDSVVTMHVTINLSYTTNGASATGFDSYILPWGDTATITKYYSHIYTSLNGCDSTVTIHVSIYPTYNVTPPPVVACGSYTLPWGDVVTTTGDYAHGYQSINGADSVVTIHATVNPVYNVTGSAGTACATYTLPWGGNATTSGNYSHTYYSVKGCDSTVTIPVTINPNPAPNIAGNTAICVGTTSTFDAGSGYSSYSWSTGATTQAISITNAGTYAVTVVNSNGCIGTASVTVNEITGNPITHNPYTDFNASPNSGTPTSLWLHIQTKLNNSSDLANSGDYIMITNGSITLNNITSNPAVSNIAIPNGKIIADNTVSSPTTSYDAANNIWITKVPPGYTSSNIFISAAIINSSTGFSVSSGKSSSITATWKTNKFGGYSSSWFYGLAAYQPQFSYSNVSAGGQVAAISNGFQSGTPIPEVGNLVAGGSGGGGSNYTGSNSSTDNFSISATPAVTASSNSPVIGGNVLDLHASNGASYSWAGPNSFTSTDQNPGISNVTYLEEGTYTVTVTNSYGCTATASTTVDVTCKGFKSYTYTQTGWGAIPSGNNAAAYRNANFPYAFPNGINVGCGANYLHLTTAIAVQDFLPSTGTAAALTQSYTNPGLTLQNVFAGQVVALVLNVGFDDYDTSFAITDAHLKDLYVKSGTFTGWTVQQVLNESQAKLGGCYSAYSVSQLNSALTSINQNYDGGTTDKGFLNCMPLRIENPPSVDVVSSLNLYPNPNSGTFMLDLDLKEPDNTEADIQITNMLGQVISTDRTETTAGRLLYKVDLNNKVPNGNYFVRVVSGGQVFTKEFVYQR